MIVLIFSIPLAVSCYLLLRNNAVLRFRQGLIARISQAAQDDITAGDFNWRWRYAALESVPYNRMVVSLRRLRPDNYYADTRFLDHDRLAHRAERQR